MKDAILPCRGQARQGHGPMVEVPVGVVARKENVSRRVDHLQTLEELRGFFGLLDGLRRQINMIAICWLGSFFGYGVSARRAL